MARARLGAAARLGVLSSGLLSLAGCGATPAPSRGARPTEPAAEVLSPARVDALRRREALHARLRTALGAHPDLDEVAAELVEIRRAFLVAAEHEARASVKVDVLYEMLQAATGAYDLFLSAWEDRFPYDWEAFPHAALDRVAPITRQARERLLAPAIRDCHDLADRRGIPRAKVPICNQFARMLDLDERDEMRPLGPPSHARASGPGIYRLPEATPSATSHLDGCALAGSARFFDEIAYADAARSRPLARFGFARVRVERLTIPSAGGAYAVRVGAPVVGDVWLAGSARVATLAERLDGVTSIVWATPGVRAAVALGARPAEAEVTPEPTGCAQDASFACATLTVPRPKARAVRCDALVLQGALGEPAYDEAPGDYATRRSVVDGTLRLARAPKQPAVATLTGVTGAYVRERRDGFAHVFGWEDPWSFDGWVPLADVAPAPDDRVWVFPLPWIVGAPHRAKRAGLVVRLRSTGEATTLSLEPDVVVLVARRDGDACSVEIQGLRPVTRDDAFVVSCDGLTAAEAESSW